MGPASLLPGNTPSTDPPDLIAGPFNGHALTVQSYPASTPVSGSLMVADGAGGRVYAANSFAGTVVALDGTSGHELGSVSLFDQANPGIGGPQFTSIAYDAIDHLVILTESMPFGGAPGELVFLDADTLATVTVVAALPGNLSFDPCALAYDASTDHVFTENALGPGITVFNATTGSFVGAPMLNASFPPPAACYDWTGIVLLSQLHEIVLGVAGLPQEVVLDTQTLQVIAGLALPAGFVIGQGLFNPQDGLIWLSNGTSTTVDLFSSSTGQMTSDLTLPFEVVGLGWDPGSSSVVATGSNQTAGTGQEIVAIDGASHAIAAQTTVNVGSPSPPLSWLAVALRPGSPSWILLSGPTGSAAQLLALATSPRSFAGITSFPGYPGAQLSVAADAGLRLTFIETNVPNSLTAYNETSQVAVWSAPVSSDGWPYSLTVDSVDHRVYVGVSMLGFLNTGVEVLDDRNGTSLGTVNVSGLIALTVDPLHGRLYALTSPGTFGCQVEIYATSTALPTFIGGVGLPACAESIVADSPYDAAFVALYGGSVATVYGANHALGPAYGVGGPVVSAMDVRSDGRVLVGDPATATVSILDPGTGTIQASFPTGGVGPDVISDDPVLGVLFVANASLSLVKALNDTSGTVLGSFPTPDATSEAAVDRATGSLVCINENRGDRTVASLAAAPAAPDPPSLVSGNGTLSVRWSSVSANPPVIDYSVLLSTNGSGNPIVVATTAGNESLIEDLTNGQTYFVAVQGVNAIGTGPPSVAVSATPRTVPSPPLGVHVTGTGESWLAIQWSAPSADGGSLVTGYAVEFQAAGGSWQDALVGPVSNFTVAGLPPDTAVAIRVVAVNSVGTSNPSLLVVGQTESSSTVNAISAYWWVVTAALVGSVVVIAVMVIRARRHDLRNDGTPSRKP